MYLSLGVREMIDAFRTTYRTIDVRSAAVLLEQKWVNTYAVVRLSYEEPQVVEERLRSLEGRHGPVRTESFRIVLGQLPFSDWGKFWDGLHEGLLHVGGEEVYLGRPLSEELGAESAYIRAASYSYIRPFDGCLWPVAEYRLFPYGFAPLGDGIVARQAVRLGYSDAHEAANLLCELNVRANNSNGFHFCLSLPVFASISGFRILPKMKQVQVEIRRHRNLSSVKGLVLFRDQDYGTTEPSKCRMPFEFLPDTADDGPLISAAGSVPLPEVRQDDWAEAQVLHPDFGPVCCASHFVRMLVPPAERNILFEALKFFCPEDEFGALVARPYEQKAPKLKESAAFELRIAWLLGLFGLSTIVLGEYEHIVVKRTNVRRGSVDILAASQRDRKLVLVACTMTMPKEDDFTNLLTTATIIAREAFADTNVRIMPLVCTSAPGCPQFWETGDGLTSIPILDADRLGLLLRLLKEGREREVFSFLDNPMHSNLNGPNESE